MTRAVSVSLLKLCFQVFQVVIFVTVTFRFAQTDAVNDAGVVLGIGEENHIGEDSFYALNNGLIGHESRTADEGCFFLMQQGHFLL